MGINIASKNQSLRFISSNLFIAKLKSMLHALSDINPNKLSCSLFVVKLQSAKQ